jgi:hypothetical protein
MLCGPEIDHQANFLDCITRRSKEMAFRPSVSQGPFLVSGFSLMGGRRGRGGAARAPAEGQAGRGIVMRPKVAAVATCRPALAPPPSMA